MSEVAKYFTRLFLVSVILYITGCAVPVAPTGGEPDRTGPMLAYSQPASGTVNFRERVIQIRFEDFVDRNSFARAFRIEPGIATPYEIKWNRKTASIHLKSPLPENTTVVFTIGSELKDTRGVNLKAPLSIAVSTGPEINRGVAKIRVQSLYGEQIPEDLRIFLYKIPYELEEAAFYLGQPDTSGLVSFNYLADGEYASFLVRDANRNRIWDEDREYSQPTAQANYTLEDGSLDMGVLYFAQRDTTSVRIESVGLLSNRRLRIEYSKPITYRQETDIYLKTTDNDAVFPARLLFVDAEDPTVAYYQSSTELSDNRSYSILADTLRMNGLYAASPSMVFEGSSEPDTSFIQFHAHLTQRGVRGVEPLVVKYTGVLDNTLVADSVQAIINREPDNEFLFIRTESNILQLTPSEPWNPSNEYTIRVWNPGSQQYVTLTTRVLDDSDFGELSFAIADSTLKHHPMMIKIFSINDEGYSIRKNFVDSTFISGIPVGSYTVVVYPDYDENGQWSPGFLKPFKQPDPIFVNNNVTVRGRMTGEIDVVFD